MSKSTTRTVVAPTAAVVRAFYLADEKRLGRLSEAGQANVRATRGRLSNEVVKAYNKGRKNPYVVGSARAADQAARAASAKRRADLKAAGVPVKDRGRLPKVTLGQSKG